MMVYREAKKAGPNNKLSIKCFKSINHTK